MYSTAFDPKKHGYHFSNNDIKWSILFIKGTALCGGMCYSALDFYYCRRALPPGKTVPPEGTPIHDYIYDRQTTAHGNTIFRFARAWGSDYKKAYQPREEYAKLKTILGHRSPVPICTANNGKGHHLIAIGCGSNYPVIPEQIKISAYDPNSPDKVATIIYDEERRAFKNSEGGWSEELFVDDGYSVQPPPSLLGTHDQWRMCWKCKGLFYNGDTLGVCPDGGPHLLGNDNYALTPDAGRTSSSWKMCFKCKGLFTTAKPGSPRICPAGGIHVDYVDPKNGNSASYILARQGEGQDNWRWCQACDGLFYPGYQSLGVCPANSNGHDGSRSKSFTLQILQEDK